MTIMHGKDRILSATDGEFHFIDWGGDGPLAHFSHATGLCAGHFVPMERPDETAEVIFDLLKNEELF
jgi:hypothetical protein